MLKALWLSLVVSIISYTDNFQYENVISVYDGDAFTCNIECDIPLLYNK
jgi:hypothetical protein